VRNSHRTQLKFEYRSIGQEILVMQNPTQQPTIIRTERGLTISGTRITLYDVMDYVTAQYPPKFIQGLFDLTEDQMTAALAYIEAHRTEVEAEYQQVLQDAEDLRKYYEKQNRDRVSRSASRPPKPGTEAAWEKLRAVKAKRQSKV
jgi:uncharacterized protein (DUF433 family)